MLRKIFIVSISIFILLIQLRNSIIVNADNVVNVYICYEKTEYEKGDKINLSIDIPAFANLFETIIRYQYDDSYLDVICKDDFYFYLDNHSIFNNFVINKKFDGNILYAEMMKDSIDNGYYSSYRNNLCKMSFFALKGIDNIEEVLNIEDFQLYLFDNNHNLINYNLHLKECINASWQYDELEFEVYDLLPSLNDLFVITNRAEDEYLLFIDQNVNLNIVQEQVILIGLFDKVTGNYQTFSKIVSVVDTTKPIIKGENEQIINDVDLDNYNFYDQVVVSDNYDNEVILNLRYFNQDLKELSKSDAVAAFKRDFKMIVGYQAKDTSGNISDDFYITYSLNDTTKPIVEIDEVINICDYELNDFVIENCITISDNLDLNPLLIISLFDSNYNLINDLKDALTVNNCCYIEVYGEDYFFNQSDKKTCVINLIDTLAPNVKFKEEVIIKDVDVDSLDFKSLLEINDNDKRENSIECKYFLTEEVDIIEFKNALKKGLRGEIEYTVYDYSLNKTVVKGVIEVLDTIAPEIKVNINHEGFYKKLDKIEVEVTDNFDDNVTINVYLDKELYNGSEISEGKHNLFVEAIDQAGNLKSINYDFAVSSSGVIENIFNGNIKIKTSVYIYVIIGLSVIFVVINVLINYKQRKKKS